MYRSCIFCSAPLGANESIERFPVGRSLAFDAAKGRLWAVCPRCARWNLAPIEERWEAIEDAERLFRDTRLRAQSENVGLAKLADGTRLVRVGQALPGELAAWRYGEQLARRQRRALWYGGMATAAGIGVFAAGVTLTSLGLMGMINLYHGYRYLGKRARQLRPVGRVEMDIGGVRTQVRLRGGDVTGAWLSDPDDGQGIALNFPRAVQVPDPGRPGETRKLPLVLRGDSALPVLSRSMVHVNARGASSDAVKGALRRIELVGSPDEFVREVARKRLLLTGGQTKGAQMSLAFEDAIVGDDEPPSDRPVALALEMALHEETERRALQGELAMLEAMWRDAEEIAAIADRLPDLPAPEPPRLNAAG
jgi:hypothetical protein